MTNTSSTHTDTHTEMANALRFLSADAVEKAASGHPGMPLGMADVATVLFRNFLRFNPKNPAWQGRDRFVLSGGHGSMLLYSLLHLTGYEDATLDAIQNFRQLGHPMAGHPEYGHLSGIETTTGPLGQGLATAVGMALASKLYSARLQNAVMDYNVYVMAGDGDLMEGISHEAISLAGHLGLNNLVVLFDDNKITIDGDVNISCSDNQMLRFAACGWDTRVIDGHDPEQIEQALNWAKNNQKPTLIACQTTIGYGAPNKQGTSATHGSPLGAAEVAAMREYLAWPYAPFEIPEHIKSDWKEFGRRCLGEHKNWQAAFDLLSVDQKRLIQGDISPAVFEKLTALKAQWAINAPTQATRQLSQAVIDAAFVDEKIIVAGSADLTGSNNTKAKSHTPIQRDHFDGDYVYYGIREHAMAACMNGLSLSGFVPYSGTFLCFLDYLKPALRLSALMEKGVIYVLTHDSIGLGEDGPTHQPIEHLAALRSIPHVLTLRPADAIETLECWEIALKERRRPTALILTRQALPPVRFDVEAKSVQGGYVLQEEAGAKATLISTGSEIHLAVQAAAQLKEKGIAVRVVSMPCVELFAERSKAEQVAVLGIAPRIIIEAASSFGWHKWMREDDHFIGIDSFGASGKAPDLFEHFGITVDAIVKAVQVWV